MSSVCTLLIRALHGPGWAWNTGKVNGPGLSNARAGPYHSFWLKIITMVRNAHVDLMVLTTGIPWSFKSGLTYEHHELSQGWYLRSPDSSTDQELLFHLILISFSFTLISCMPICTWLDLCLWINSHQFVPLFRHYKSSKFHTVIRILNWLFCRSNYSFSMFIIFTQEPHVTFNQLRNVLCLHICAAVLACSNIGQQWLFNSQLSFFWRAAGDSYYWSPQYKLMA